MAQDFTGNSLAMTSDGLSAAAAKLGVSPVEIWTVFAVETSGCGFLNTRSPIIRYERAVFSKLTTIFVEVLPATSNGTCTLSCPA